MPHIFMLLAPQCPSLNWTETYLNIFVYLAHVQVNGQLELKLIQKNNMTVVAVNKIHLDLSIGDIEIQLINLFNGNQVLGKGFTIALLQMLRVNCAYFFRNPVFYIYPKFLDFLEEQNRNNILSMSGYLFVNQCHIFSAPQLCSMNLRFSEKSDITCKN